MPTKLDPLRMRELVAQESARLMYEESVSEYARAKRMAAKRLFGGQRNIHARKTPLPSNGEIQEALRELATQQEGAQARQHLLFELRTLAHRHMRALQPFSPRLIGSVATGHARRGSDIDLHLFSDHREVVARHMDQLGWRYHHRVVQIRRTQGFVVYHHYDIEATTPIEATVYPRIDLRARPRSSTDGKPMLRLDLHQLRALIEIEHPQHGADHGAPPSIDHV